MTQNPLQNSRLFDPYRWSTATEVKAACLDLRQQLGLNDKRYDSYVLMVLLDLYCSWRSDPSQYVSCSRDQNRYGKSSRYKSVHVGYRGMITLMNRMLDNGYIDYAKGRCYRDAVTGKPYAGYTSRMRATRKLIKLIVKHKVKLSMISRHPNEQVIILRSEKVDGIAEELPVETLPPTVKRSANVLMAYNQLLNKSYIDIADDLVTDYELRAADIREYSIDLSKKRVYRVFNDGKWTHGGRIYGAWWHGCPKVLRKYIVIGDEPTIELDFSSIHILLLYAKFGINFLESGIDAYTIEGYDCRDIVKIVLQAAINAKPNEKGDGDSRTVLATWDSIVTKCNQERKAAGITTHATLYNMLDALKEIHKPIANYLASGEGIKLQLQDSEMALKLIERHTECKIPILTIHDSFIVPYSFGSFTREWMKEVYGELVSEYLGAGYNSTIETIDALNGTVTVEDTSNNINLDKLIKPAFTKAVIENTITRINGRLTSDQQRRYYKWNKSKYQYYVINKEL